MIYRRLTALLAALALSFTCATFAGPARADAEDSLTLEDKLDAMLPVLDSIARSMGIDGEVGYAPSEPQFFWTVLYLMGENWGYTHPLCQSVDRGSTTVRSLPKAAVQEMASAAFYDYNQLPELVDTSSITYDAATDGYLFEPSDMGTSYTGIDSYSVHENGNIALTLGFYEEGGGRLGGFEFTLIPNPHADAVANPIYFYSVMSASAQPLDGLMD